MDTEKYANRLKSVKIFKFEKDYISIDKIKAIIKDLEEFDENFYDNKTLKLAFKNSLQSLLEEE